MTESKLAVKSMDFAVKIVDLHKKLQNNKEFSISNQIIRSGTSIGANVREAKFAQSDLDFIHKMSIYLKEANETLYWIELLKRTEYLPENEYSILHKDCDELLRMLHSTVLTCKKKLDR